MTLKSTKGVFDFVNEKEVSDERQFYECEYNRIQHEGNQESIKSTQSQWEDPWHPQNQLLFKALGDLKGKRILLIGNGHSTKELSFLLQNPSALIYSDLSVNAVTNIKSRFELDKYKNVVDFAAIDAHQLPFFDSSIDIVYGYGMVHHLPDIDLFLSEVIRVLTMNGRAVFLDDAYSPIWHYSKQTILRPLMTYSHKKTGISPEDYRFSMTGGFKESILADIIRVHGGLPWFARTSLLQYLWERMVDKLLPAKLVRPAMHRCIANVLRTCDQGLAVLPLAKNNLIRLAWGFYKNM
jgi:SAM-dependent methyltransferase